MTLEELAFQKANSGLLIIVQNNRRTAQVRIFGPRIARTNLRRQTFLQMGSEAVGDHVCNYGSLLHKCNVRATLEFTVDRQAMLEPCRAPHLRSLEPRMARTCTPPPSLHPLPKFTSRQRTIIVWDASTRANPLPHTCLSRLPKSRPPTPLYPQGVCFQPPAIWPTVQNQRLTEQSRRSNKQKRAAFRSIFGPNRGYFAPFLAFFAGLRRSVRSGTTPSRSMIFARRQGERQ